jgi:hypothetical protein
MSICNGSLGIPERSQRGTPCPLLPPLSAATNSNYSDIRLRRQSGAYHQAGKDCEEDAALANESTATAARSHGLLLVHGMFLI